MIQTERNSSKNNIHQSFSDAAPVYDEHAEIQRKVADGVTASIRPWKDIIPEGPVLEVGCGTGLLTRTMSSEFPDRKYICTDLSEAMLQQVKNADIGHDDLIYERLDVDQMDDAENPEYALIVSSFTPQWFADTAIGLEKLTKKLKPGGLLLTAFPGNNSFTEWYEHCLKLGLPYTANPLPDVEEVVVKLSVGPVQIDYYENNLTQKFTKSLDFFRNLKAVGAHTSKSNKSLTAKQFKLLTSFWDEHSAPEIKVSWHIVYLAVKKDMI